MKKNRNEHHSQRRSQLRDRWRGLEVRGPGPQASGCVEAHSGFRTHWFTGRLAVEWEENVEGLGLRSDGRSWEEPRMWKCAATPLFFCLVVY